ncbi:MAG TPA: nucleotidyltransferase family protein [Pyrinomonadaceae bacterium]|nr:nucleotidyltransferase family protein [Pyrinomonadaceae bacterium]
MKRREVKITASNSRPDYKTSDDDSVVPVGRLIAKALAGSWLNPPPRCELSTAELARIAPLLIKSGAGGLLWRCIRETDFAHTKIGADLQAVYRLQRLESLAHIQKIKTVITHLHAAGIDSVLMKGWGVARLYPEAGLRHYTDLDLCFAPERARAARTALKDLGPLELYVDVHQGLGRHEKLAWSDILSRAETVNLEDVTVRILGAEDHLRLLCLHWLRHDAWNPIGLCDIAAAFASRRPDFDWPIALGSDQKHADWMACAIGLAHQLLGVDVEGTPIAERAQRLPTWLVTEVLEQWETCLNANYRDIALAEVGPLLRSPSRVVKELSVRWHYPIRATMEVGGNFNQWPRAPYQVAAVLLRWTEFPRQIAMLIARWFRAQRRRPPSSSDTRNDLLTLNSEM